VTHSLRFRFNTIY